MEEIAAFLKQHKYDELGIATFGPLCLNKEDPEYGNITTTPKINWRHFPLL